MATPVFTWNPAIDPQGATTFRVRAAQFSDGYSQTVADGLNNRADSWPLTFAGNGATITPIRTFLDAQQGWRSFYWTPPLRAQGLFRASQYTLIPHGSDLYTLNVTFTEVFNP